MFLEDISDISCLSGKHRVSKTQLCKTHAQAVLYPCEPVLFAQVQSMFHNTVFVPKTHFFLARKYIFFCVSPVTCAVTRPQHILWSDTWIHHFHDPIVMLSSQFWVPCDLGFPYHSKMLISALLDGSTKMLIPKLLVSSKSLYCPFGSLVFLGP